MVTKMQLFNNRQDVDWFEFSVFDKDFEQIPHSVINGKIQNVNYLQRKTIEVYIRSKDIDRATYICSRSKNISNSNSATFIASRICSKIK